MASDTRGGFNLGREAVSVLATSAPEDLLSSPTAREGGEGERVPCGTGALLPPETHSLQRVNSLITALWKRTLWTHIFQNNGGKKRKFIISLSVWMESKITYFSTYQNNTTNNNKIRKLRVFRVSRVHVSPSNLDRPRLAPVLGRGDSSSWSRPGVWGGS